MLRISHCVDKWLVDGRENISLKTRLDYKSEDSLTQIYILPLNYVIKRFKYGLSVTTASVDYNTPFLVSI
jgi:hypothetical protein